MTASGEIRQWIDGDGRLRLDGNSVVGMRLGRADRIVVTGSLWWLVDGTRLRVFDAACGRHVADFAIDDLEAIGAAGDRAVVTVESGRVRIRTLGEDRVPAPILVRPEMDREVAAAMPPADALACAREALARGDLPAAIAARAGTRGAADRERSPDYATLDRLVCATTGRGALVDVWVGAATTPAPPVALAFAGDHLVTVSARDVTILGPGATEVVFSAPLGGAFAALHVDAAGDTVVVSSERAMRVFGRDGATWRQGHELAITVCLGVFGSWGLVRRARSATLALADLATGRIVDLCDWALPGAVIPLPDLSSVARFDRDGVELYELPSGTSRGRRELPGRFVAVSADFTRWALLTDRTVVVVDALSLDEIARVKAAEGTAAVALSPCGTLAWTGGPEGWSCHDLASERAYAIAFDARDGELDDTKRWPCAADGPIVRVAVTRSGRAYVATYDWDRSAEAPARAARGSGASGADERIARWLAAPPRVAEAPKPATIRARPTSTAPRIVAVTAALAAAALVVRLVWPSSSSSSDDGDAVAAYPALAARVTADYEAWKAATAPAKLAGSIPGDAPCPIEPGTASELEQARGIVANLELDRTQGREPTAAAVHRLDGLVAAYAHATALKLDVVTEDPKTVGSHHEFASGSVFGLAYVYAFDRRTIVCVGKVLATSSAKVMVHLDGAGAELDDDLTKNLRAAVAPSLRAAVHVE